MGLELCPECKKMHYTTNPCSQMIAKKSTAALKPIEVQARVSPRVARASDSGVGKPSVDNSRLGKKALAGEVPRVNEQPETEGKLVQVQQSQPAPTIGPFSARENLHKVLNQCDLPSPQEKAMADEAVARFDKKAWMREYMREHRKGIRRRQAK